MSRHILAKSTPICFSPVAKQTPPQKNVALFFPPTARKGAAHKKTLGAASRTTPPARGGKNGIFWKNMRQRNLLPPILRLGT